MKTSIKNTLFASISLFLLLSACRPHNPPGPPNNCNAKIYGLMSTDWDLSNSPTFDIVDMQKPLSGSSQTLSTGNTFASGNGMLAYPQTTINTTAGKIIYHFGNRTPLYVFDMNTNTVTTASVPGTYDILPEYLGSNLYFLSFGNLSGTTVDLYLKDINNNTVSQFTGFDFSNTGVLDYQMLLSTSDKQNRIFYLANTKIIVYDQSNNTWTDYLLEAFNINTNKVIYKGIEYVSGNVLYALRGDYTNTGSETLKLVKIDLSNATPQVSVLKDLTNQMSVSALNVINGNAWVGSTYDSCDDTYYFTYTDPGNPSSILFEIDVPGNTVQEYPFSGKVLYGLDIDN